jgi:methionyl-tRNA formyltransferase
MKIALVGATVSTERTLQTLARCGQSPVLVLTLPPEKSGRHSDFVDLQPLAANFGVDVVHTNDVNDPELLVRLSELDLDLTMVIGWSRLCGREFIGMPRLGTLGYHPALLPLMRGRAALAWTILLAPAETGGSLFWMDDGVDSGPIAAQRSFPLDGTETLAELLDLQMDALEKMLPSLVEQLARGERPAEEQDHSRATYLALRRPADGEIDWSRPAGEIERLVRAVSRPYPGAFTFHRGRRLTIRSARVVSCPQWFAQTGQVFTYEDGAPIVRCGDNTDLMLTDLEFEPSAEGADNPVMLSGQPRLGRLS